LEDFPNIPLEWENKKIYEKWEQLKIVRNVANAAIEVKRTNKDIGSSLEADVELYLQDKYLKLVKDINLSEFLITSNAKAVTMTNKKNFFKIDGIDDIAVFVKKAEGEKCSRCWKVMGNPCERCKGALKN
jgi:Isoleucyl-tRNA synthetase